MLVNAKYCDVKEFMMIGDLCGAICSGLWYTGIQWGELDWLLNKVECLCDMIFEMLERYAILIVPII